MVGVLVDCVSLIWLGLGALLKGGVVSSWTGGICALGWRSLLRLEVRVWADGWMDGGMGGWMAF